MPSVMLLIVIASGAGGVFKYLFGTASVTISGRFSGPGVMKQMAAISSHFYFDHLRFVFHQ